ncbi:snRNA-activating protein complex subunit 2-like, partial [Mustelus asterias]
MSLFCPFQIWTELAEEATGKVDEVISTAFFQTLMIAATEPVSQGERSRRPVPASSAPREGSVGSLPRDSELGSSGLPPVTELVPASLEEPGAPATPLDFEKIYQFLSAAVQGSTFPQLSPF